MITVRGSKFAGPEWQETSRKKAERILAEELQRRGWDVQRLEPFRKADSVLRACFGFRLLPRCL